MASFRERLWSALAALPALALVCVPVSYAQQPAAGFAVERLYQSAPGAGWFVMDDLNISGGLGGALELSSGYAHNPLVISRPDGTQKLAVVTQQAFLDLGGAVTYHRYRAYLNLPTPLLGTGNRGVLGPYQFTAPNVTLGTTPDSLSDSRLGFDVRLGGLPGARLRVGAGAQLIIPSDTRANYDTDGRYRAMFRCLAAGNAGAYSYAGQIGIHVRPLHEAPVPGSPDGNELLYGISGGRRFRGPGDSVFIAGPEIFGEAALKQTLSHENGTEALLTGRMEETHPGRKLRIKLGLGHALVQNFGAAQWRLVFAVEVFGHR